MSDHGVSKIIETSGGSSFSWPPPGTRFERGPIRVCTSVF